MSYEITTLFRVSIKCTETQAKVLTDTLDSLDKDFDNPDWAGHLQHDYLSGELSIDSYESGQPRELGELIARGRQIPDTTSLCRSCSPVSRAASYAILAAWMCTRASGSGTTQLSRILFETGLSE